MHATLVSSLATREHVYAEAASLAPSGSGGIAIVHHVLRINRVGPLCGKIRSAVS
jgi:hypothetical protein